MTSPEDALWPGSDPELVARMAAAPDYLLHTWMCDCAEHALSVCDALAGAAGYGSMPEPTPIEVKRSWLAGEADDADLERAQYQAVPECYWGKPLALGAAVLGAAWYPGSGLALAEDEHYAESMSYYPSAFAAACDVMRECMKAVGDVAHRAALKSGDPSSAGEVWRRAREAEMAWQRSHILSAPAACEKLASHGRSQKGQGRNELQDAFLAATEIGLFVVVDAMGSARAAAIALSIFEETIRSARHEGMLDGALTRAARSVHEAIKHVIVMEPSHRGIGAQFVALLVDEHEARVAWIGQCRCYRSREGKTERMTKDDRTLGCAGPVDPGFASDEPVLPLIDQVLGGDHEVHVHEEKLPPPKPEDTYLLSTDGLHGLYQDKVHLVLDGARNEALPRLTSLLMQSAVDVDDDATALCVRIGA
ncbi:SpoIIE family protein phosphatase [Polyangium sp. 6x1]|uniref:PP2C family protein-serine/threonine phosphatase n=1 Tax=Polyangium sp. 6x1 TaxID=3042689 RepID=UPI0024826452|nr:SpoIIE family protein phosphatase [Polyangium sp. 6x1]MDI1449529.1 SpoIIE family protein phosphatase [Polyangium sp. 6x1]